MGPSRGYTWRGVGPRYVYRSWGSGVLKVVGMGPGRGYVGMYIYTGPGKMGYESWKRVCPIGGWVCLY